MLELKFESKRKSSFKRQLYSHEPESIYLLFFIVGFVAMSLNAEDKLGFCIHVQATRAYTTKIIFRLTFQMSAKEFVECFQAISWYCRCSISSLTAEIMIKRVT